MSTEIIPGPYFWPPRGVVDEALQPACAGCGEVIEHGDEYVMVGSCCLLPWHAECRRAKERSEQQV